MEAEAHGDPPPATYREILAKMAGGPGFMVNHVLNYRFPWKAHIAARDGYWAVPVVLTYIRVGDLAISPLGAEVFNAISSVVKRSTDSQPTIFTSVSSRCIGYLPTAEEQARGGYEADTYWYFIECQAD